MCAVPVPNNGDTLRSVDPYTTSYLQRCRFVEKVLPSEGNNELYRHETYLFHLRCLGNLRHAICDIKIFGFFAYCQRYSTKNRTGKLSIFINYIIYIFFFFSSFTYLYTYLNVRFNFTNKRD